MFYEDYGYDGRYDDRPATDAEADREEAREIGRANPHLAWIGTDRDAIHANPFYVGPPQPHPSDVEHWVYEADEQGVPYEEYEAARMAERAEFLKASPPRQPSWAGIDDDIPF